MRDLDLVVSGDTGLTHVAAAVGVPVVLLLKAGSPTTDFWLDNKHSRVFWSQTGRVADLSVEHVLNAVLTILFERGKIVYNNE